MVKYPVFICLKVVSLILFSICRQKLNRMGVLKFLRFICLPWNSRFSTGPSLLRGWGGESSKPRPLLIFAILRLPFLALHQLSVLLRGVPQLF